MKDQLVLRIRDETPAQAEQAAQLVEWYLFDSVGQLQQTGAHQLADVISSSEPSSDITNDISGDTEICVIIPAEAVLLTSATIPSNQIRHIKRALPFALEEVIADDVEDVHISIPSKSQLATSQGEVFAAVIGHQLLIDWLEQWYGHGIAPQVLLIDALCVPFETNTISILIDPSSQLAEQDSEQSSEQNSEVKYRLLIRTGDYTAISIEADDFELLFGTLIPVQKSTEVKPKIKIMRSVANQKSQSVVDHLVAFIHDSYSDYDSVVVDYTEEISEVLATTAYSHNNNALNLLQGGYAVNRNTEQGWRQWRWAASIVVIGLTVYLLTSLASGLYFNYQADSINQQATALYKQLFPNERRIISPKKQMQNHLRLIGGSSEGQFLPFLADTASHFSIANSAQSLLLQQLRYDNKSGHLFLQVQGSSIEQFDKLKTNLANAGLSLEINSATEENDYFLARLIVKK